MSVFDLDRRGQDQIDEEARLNPLDISEVDGGIWDGTSKAVGMGLMRGGVQAARATNILMAAPVAAADALTGQGGDLTDRYFQSFDPAANDAVDFWTPKAHEVGAAGRVLGGLAEIVPQLMATGGNPSLMLATQTATPAADLVRQGVDAETATGIGLIQGASTAVGFRLPFLGKTLASRILTGVAGNLATNTGASAFQHDVLALHGYDEQAAQFDPMNLEARAVDVLTGLAFGGLAHMQMRPSDRAAVATASDAKHFQSDTAPGRPADLAAHVAHQQAIEQAVQAVLRGEAVVPPPEVSAATFEPVERPAVEVPAELRDLDPVDTAPAKLPEAVGAQIDALGVPDSTKAQLTDLYTQASRVKPGFDQSVRDIAKAVGSTLEPMIAGLKGVARAAEKAMADYGGDAKRLKDLVRATVLVDNIDQVQRVIEEVQRRYGGVTKFRDTLRSPLETTDGYRDVNMNVVVDGHVAELQVNLPEMVRAKEAMHGLYEERRTIEAKGPDLSAADVARINELDAQMRDAYAAAWTEATSRLKSASETSKPSSLAQDMETGRPAGTSNARTETPPSGVGSAATGTPSTFQKTGSLPKTGAAIDTPPTAGSVPDSGRPASATGQKADPIIAAARQAAVAADLRVPTGEIDADGNPVTVAASDLLARSDAEIAQAQKDSAAYEAAVNCFLSTGAQ